MNYELLFRQALDAVSDESFIYVFYPGLYLDSYVFDDSLSGKGFEVSEKALFSQEYAGCNGVALIGDRFGALSHYNLDLGNADSQLKEMVREFFKMDDCPQAFLIGGRRSHANFNRNILERAGIPISGEYVDGFGFDNPSSLSRYPLPAKDVLVIPREGVVIVRAVKGLSKQFKKVYKYYVMNKK